MLNLRAIYIDSVLFIAYAIDDRWRNINNIWHRTVFGPKPLVRGVTTVQQVHNRLTGHLELSKRRQTTRMIYQRTIKVIIYLFVKFAVRRVIRPSPFLYFTKDLKMYAM